MDQSQVFEEAEGQGRDGLGSGEGLTRPMHCILLLDLEGSLEGVGDLLYI